MELPNRGLDVSSIAAPQWFNPVLIPPASVAPHLVRTIEVPPASAWTVSASRRVLEFSVALAVLIFLALPMLLIALCVRITSEGPALFVQKRVGRGGRLFGIYKFRSMTNRSGAGPGLTRSGDGRVTTVGRWIRKFKLDELPQFYNVLRGEMSLVGPRPKLPLYESLFNMPYRPGITGAATLAFRNEEEILSAVHASQLDHFYARQIKPLKTRIDIEYMSQATLRSDLRLIAATFLACLAPEPIRRPVHTPDTQAEKNSMLA
jgi:lipopolysaccharide/colanic/teichoic acid biosynthesis glycosyltransferase